MQKFKRLKSKKEITFIFECGASVSSFPIKLFFIKNSDQKKSSVAFTVGKKNIAKAVDRNKVKRLMREVFRLGFAEEKGFFGHSLVFVFLGKEVVSFDLIKKGFFGVFEKFISNKN
jgi:ribonuclease P protein component